MSTQVTMDNGNAWGIQPDGNIYRTGYGHWQACQVMDATLILTTDSDLANGCMITINYPTDFEF